MNGSGQKGEGKKKVNEIKIFPVPFALDEIKTNIPINTNSPSKPSEEQIINQAIQCHLKGNISEAAKLYQYFIRQGFNDHRVFSNYGVILRDLGQLEKAEICTRKAIEIKSDYPDAFSNLGMILRDLGQLEEAEICTRKAIEIKSDYPEAHSNLGIILKDLGQLEEAELSVRKAIKIKSDYQDAYYNLFCHYEEINDLEKLKESLNEFKNIDCIENELLLFRARLSFRKKEYQTAKDFINNISPLWIETSSKYQEIKFWSYKAFIEDKIGNHDIAFSCFEKSQDDSSYLRFNKDSYFNLIDSYKKSIILKEINHNEFNDGIEDSNLSFLIGFPRSGTTLLDTILRSHKDIEVIEEQPFIYTIEKLIQEKLNTKINNLYSLNKYNIINLRKKYFELLKQYTNKEASLIIDKFPLSTVSLPLINLLFPNAKIIFTHRHPYDTVLSCFQQCFTPNIAMANLVSLKSSSIMYDQVMNAWDIYKNNLPVDFITSRYENLVEDFDGHTLKILDFLGVGWDENVKNYRKTALGRGNIGTPSSSQVVQPLYKSSINKWKNYEKYFEDCHQYLEKWVSYFGY